jgi:outer membrane translocation and assembly module TamA
VSARAGVLDLTTATANDSYASAETPAEALSQRSRFVVVGIGAALDTRSSRSDPHDGLFAGLAAWRFNARAGDASDFTRVALDARSYWTPFTRRGVVAARFLLSTDTTGAGGEVPFSLQQSLGGGDTLRGLPLDRYRDLSLGYATAEYRFELNSVLDAGPFVDVGAVGPALSRLSLGNVRATYGLRAGVRYHSHVLLHLDLGRSPTGYRFTVGTGVLF